MLPGLETHFNFPLSGNVNQTIEPDWFFNAIAPEAGDSDIEKQVFAKASYGKQLGLITDALLAISEELKPDATTLPAVSKLRELHSEIEDIKTANQKRLGENARRILDKLKAADRDEFDRLMNAYAKE